MCNLYHVSPKTELETYLRRHAAEWVLPEYSMTTVGPFGTGLFITATGAALGQWGMIRPGQAERIDYMESQRDRATNKARADGEPVKRGRPRSTNNARVEGVATKPTFKGAWLAGRRCLVPASWYQEPNWETLKNVWWRLQRRDGDPWMLGGLWSEWIDPKTGEVVPNFTMLTTNCDGHPLLARLHKPDTTLPADRQDKRSLVQVDPANWDRWLNGSIADAAALIQPASEEVFDLADAIRTDQLLAAMPR